MAEETASSKPPLGSGSPEAELQTDWGAHGFLRGIRSNIWGMREPGQEAERACEQESQVRSSLDWSIGLWSKHCTQEVSALETHNRCSEQAAIIIP